MTNQRFEILAHTADKSIRAYGRNLKELFENAAVGMFSLMAESDKYTPTEQREFSVEASDSEFLIRAWLAELLYTFEVDRILFVDFDIRAIDGYRLEAVAFGLPFDHNIEWLGSAVKAVTHHNLHVHRTDERWEAQVVFDV